jgi:membrane protease YdiL (CAAX protease family)
MAGTGESGTPVIAGKVAEEPNPTIGAWTLILHACWACIAAVVTWRSRWLQGTRPVLWPGRDRSDLVRLAIAVILASPMTALASAWMGVRTGANPTLDQMLALSLAAAALPIAAWLLLPTGAPSGGATPTRLSTAMLAGLLGLLVCWPFLQLAIDAASRLQQALGGEAAPALGHSTLETLRAQAREPATWGVAATAVLITPLAEEITWRGLIQQALKRARLPVPAAILLTSTGFALFHWSVLPAAARPGGLAALTLLGVTLGWLTERTGRIEAAMTAHAAFNLANLLLFSMLPE